MMADGDAVVSRALDIACRERALLSQLLHSGAGPKTSSEWRRYYVEEAARETGEYPRYFNLEETAADQAGADATSE